MLASEEASHIVGATLPSQGKVRFLLQISGNPRRSDPLGSPRGDIAMSSDTGKSSLPATGSP
jgi:hypothetical protein